MKNISKDIRINRYKKFRNKFLNDNINKKFNSKNYCLLSKNTSYRIFNYFKKIKLKIKHYKYFFYLKFC